MDAIARGRGGYITLPAWRPDVGALPSAASVSVPSLGIAGQPATILRDGLVRARIPRDKAASDGEHEALWTLTVPVYGAVLQPEGPPPEETIEVDSQFVITDDAELLRPDRGWFDAYGAPTPAYVRAKQLFGIPPIDGDGRLMTDEAIATSIRAAIARVERTLGIVIGRVFVSSLPAELPPTDEATGEPIRRQDEAPYDFDPGRLRDNYGFMRLRRFPVRKVQAIELWLGDAKVTAIPPRWILLNGSRGDVQLLPGALTTLALPGSLLAPMAVRGYGGSVVPHMWRAAYEAGMDMTPDLLEVVSWIATQVLLMIVSDSTIAGIASQSVSIDGISESIATTSSATNSTYGANIIELEKRIKAWFDTVGPTYTGVRMVVS